MKDKIKGAFFLTAVIVIWVGSAVLIRNIFTSGDTDFNKPFFLTYYNTAFFMVYLIPVCFRLTQKEPHEHDSDAEQAGSDEEAVTDDSPRQLVNVTVAQRLNFKQELKLIGRISLEFCFIWVASNYFYNASLGKTSVSTATVLSNSSSIFVYLFGLCFMKDVTFSLFRALSVLVSFAGIVLIAVKG